MAAGHRGSDGNLDAATAASFRLECLRQALTHAVSRNMTTEQWIKSAADLAEFVIHGKQPNFVPPRPELYEGS